jgi:tRNA threonylcarbamoyladenosine biosynthesis protein TsaB
MAELLAIETSSEVCSVALSLGGKVLERHVHAPLRHAELLLPAISGLLAEAGCGLSRVDAIAFGRGPGSFTSLRIGIGVVQGLAWGAGLPVVPQSSLGALALEAFDNTAGVIRARVAIDARMREVFCGEFQADPVDGVRPLAPERVCAPGAAWPQVSAGEAYVAAGNGFARFEQLRPAAEAAAARFPELWPRAACVARLAEAWLRDHEPLPPERAQPVYLRDDVADKPG